ncbi:hypothetical protein BMS3Abin10_01724 [bacterium BMS3Abin10]|nr:hypothetical protein BMS3Abin10_01724 [bacterium BMS3Abin10]
MAYQAAAALKTDAIAEMSAISHSRASRWERSTSITRLCNSGSTR